MAASHRQPSLARALARLFRALIVAAAIAYGALLAFLYFDQRVLIFPGILAHGTAFAAIHPPTGDGRIVTLTAGRYGTVAGYWAPPVRDARPAGRTILFFYGNANCISSCWDMLARLRALGCSVMLVEYPGFGISTGVASDRGCYAAADAAYDYATQVRDVPSSRIISAGWSLGTSAAIHLAATRPVGALMTFSAFTSMAEMASHRYPIVPDFIISRLLKYPFPNQAEIAKVHCPTLIAHGALDEYVPPLMASRLAASDRGPVTRILVDGVGHNDILVDGGPALWKPVRAWIDGLPAPHPLRTGSNGRAAAG